LGAQIEGWFKRPKKGGQIRKNKKNLRYVIIEGCEEKTGWIEELVTNVSIQFDTPLINYYHVAK